MEVSVDTRRKLFGAVVGGEVAVVRSVAREVPAAVREGWPGGGGASYLHLAASEGQTDVCAALVELGLDVNLPAPEAATVPLAKAAGAGHTGTVRWLLRHGAQVDGSPRSVATPLMSAAVGGHLEVAAALLDAGAEVNREHLKLPQTALDFAVLYQVKRTGQEAVAQLLRKRGGIRPYAEEHDWKGVDGQAFIEHLERTVGRVNPEAVRHTKTGVIVYKGVVAPKAEFKLLFTVGLAATAKYELAFCLKWGWPLNRASEDHPRYGWPIGALMHLSAAIAAGGPLAHGDVVTSADLGLKSGDTVGTGQWIVARSARVPPPASGAARPSQLFVIGPVTSSKPVKPGTASKALADKREQAAWKALALDPDA